MAVTQKQRILAAARKQPVDKLPFGAMSGTTTTPGMIRFQRSTEDDATVDSLIEAILNLEAVDDVVSALILVTLSSDEK